MNFTDRISNYIERGARFIEQRSHKSRGGSVSTQLRFTCSKSTTETLEKDTNCVQSYKYKHQSDVNGVVLVFLLLILNIFPPIF